MINASYIPLRYARALNEYAKQHSAQDSIYDQCKKALIEFRGFMALKQLLGNPLLKIDERYAILSAVFGHQTGPVLSRFLHFLTENKREDYIQEIIVRFVRMYREEHRILNAVLITASEADIKTEKLILEMVTKRTGSTVELEKKIDPELIGGFVLELDNLRWDASLSGELKKISGKLTELNRKQSM